MSDQYLNVLTIVASTDEAKKQLKDFTQKSKSTNKPFSLKPTFPIPKCFRPQRNSLLENGLAIIQARNGDDRKLNEMLGQDQFRGKGISTIQDLETYLISNNQADLKAAQELYDYINKHNIADQQDWCRTSWGVKWDAFQSKIISDDPERFQVEFMAPWGAPDAWLKKVSQDYPDLYFYDTFYYAGEEGMIEGQNGVFIDHDHYPTTEMEITSDSLKNYPAFTKLSPKDKNGNELPFTFVVVSQDSLIIRIFDRITRERCLESIDQRFYEDQLFVNVQKVCKEKNISMPVNFSGVGDDPALEYSIIIHCKTISEAKEAAYNLMAEISKPIDEAISRLKDILIREFGLDESKFETKLSGKP